MIASLRAAIGITAGVEAASGDLLYAAFCVLSMMVLAIAARQASRSMVPVPLAPALEVMALALMVADMTIGNLLGLYQTRWYDKTLHFANSVLIGAVAFLFIYLLHLAGRTRFHRVLDGVAIVLVTLGLGASWEIGEYAVDRLFGRVSQGSPGVTPIDDTMLDLILDAIGGVIGAIAGPLYLRAADRHRTRVAALARALEARERLDSPGRE